MRVRPPVIIRKIVLIFVILIAACVAAEAITFLINPYPHKLRRLRAGDYQLSRNAILKYEYIPGHRATDKHYGAAQDNFAINSAGFRDSEFPVKKKAGVTRIILLGDSIAAGNGIADMHAIFSRQLEQILNNGATPFRYEVFNMAVGGYDTYQEAETLRVKGIPYAPDIVIVAFCLNDFDAKADGGVYDYLTHALSNEEKSILEYWTRSARPWLLSNSRLAFFFYHYMRGVQADEKGDKNPVVQGFALLDSLARQYNFKVIAYIFPSFDTVFSQYRNEKLCQHVFECAKPYERIKVVDLKPFFSARSDNAAQFSYDGQHLNALGHKVTAEIIARDLEKHNDTLF